MADDYVKFKNDLGLAEIGIGALLQDPHTKLTQPDRALSSKRWRSAMPHTQQPHYDSYS